MKWIKTFNESIDPVPNSEFSKFERERSAIFNPLLGHSALRAAARMAKKTRRRAAAGRYAVAFQRARPGKKT